MMSSSDDEEATTGDAPIDVFTEANSRFQQRLAAIEEGDPNAPKERVDAVDEFLSTMAAVDPRESLKRQTIQIVSENVDFMTKTAVETQLNEEIRQSDTDSARPDIRECLDPERIDRIEKLTSDESEAETRWRFVFTGGDTLLVDAETLYSPTEFRRAYNGVYDTLPVFDGDIDDWETLLAQLQEEFLVVKTDAVGPRSSAIMDLRSKIARNEAYIERANAARESGVLIDVGTADEPIEAAEAAETVWILYDEIKRICEDNDISPEALRWELDNRNLRTGSTKELRFEGQKAPFWPLRRSEFEPKIIEYREESDTTGNNESDNGNASDS